MAKQAHYPARRGRGWVEDVGLVMIAAGVIWFFMWTVRPTESTAPWWDEMGEGYYNLQLKGFLKGQLNLDREVEPGMLALADPWDATQRAGMGLHDASYFEGKYHMYFGVTPVLVLFAPFYWLSGGRFLGEHTAAVVFGVVGIFVVLGLLRAVRRRHFPEASVGWMWGAALTATMTTMVPVLLRRASIWEVPIMGAQALSAVFLALFYRYWMTRRWGWLAAASLVAGLVVGARPVYLPALAVLLLPGLVTGREGGRWGRELGAAVGPAALIGVGLAWYNFARFGNPLEFGQTYQMAGEKVSELVLFDWGYLWYGFRLYFLEPAGWSPFFPFFTVIEPPEKPPGHMGFENPYGVLPNMPFLAVAIVGGWSMRRWWTEERRALRWWAAAGAGYAALVIGVVMGFGGITNRYMVDFVPTLAGLAAIGALSISAELATRRSRWARFGWGVVGGGLVLYGVAFNVFVSMQHNRLLAVNHAALYERVATRANHVSEWFRRVTGREVGPLELDVVFPAGAESGVAPLVVTGSSFLSDYVFVNYLGERRARLGFEHTNFGGFSGEAFEMRPGEVRRVRVELGSLYPPRAHPFWARFEPGHGRYLQRLVRVTIDGEEVLRSMADTYDAVAWEPELGTETKRLALGERFTGTIVVVGRAEPPEAPPAVRTGGPVRLEATLPEWRGVKAEPLLTTGVTGAGDLVYVKYESEGTVRIGYDHWGVGGPVSEPIAVPEDRRVTIEIDLASLYPAGVEGDGVAGARREGVLVRLNGALVLQGGKRAHPSHADEVSVGANALGASTATMRFSGTIHTEARLGAPLMP